MAGTTERHTTQNSFVAVALHHRLISQQHAERIVELAEWDKIDQADATLSLSFLAAQEVDAVQLLARPSDVAPGFTLTDLVGCGSAGIVFRARQTALDRDVAIKTMSLKNHTSGNSAARIQREAHAIARLTHPNIVAVYDSGFHQGRFFIAMEFVEGEDLATLISRSGALPETMVWMIARQVASALAHASAAGVIHRDIKPANVLLTHPPFGSDIHPRSAFVKVADFGLAFQPTDPDETNLTAMGTTLGTPAYVAPEQLLDTHVDTRADIYSLGATVFHMLSGDAPYVDSSPMKAIISKTTGEDAWRDNLPTGLAPSTVNLFRAMTEKNLLDRIGDYNQLIRRIDAVVAEFDSSPANTSSPRPARQRRARLRITQAPVLVWLALLTLVAATLTVAALFFLDSSEDRADSSENVSQMWVAAGLPQPLFNGQSVPLFRQSGNWSAALALEGGRVLVGRENARMTFPLEIKHASTLHMRFRVRVQPQPEAFAEIVLPDPYRQSGTDRRTALLIGQGRAQLVYARSNGKSREMVSGSRVIDLRSGDPEDGVFQECQISRQGDAFHLSVNGSHLGNINCDANDAGSLTFRSIHGDVHFADIDIVELVEESDSK